MPSKYQTFGFEEWSVSCTPARFQSVLKKHMARATELNGMVGVKAQREVLKSSTGLSPNAALTVMIKGSSKPLVDFADLYGSITYEVTSPFSVFVGVLKTDGDMANIAYVLHEGQALVVTPEMRGMFFYLWKASKGDIPAAELTGRAAELWARRPGGWLPLAPETTVITTPPRPWVTMSMGDPAFKAAVKLNWDQALQATFQELVRGNTKPSDFEKFLKKLDKAGGKVEKAAKAAGKGFSKVGKSLGKAAKAAKSSAKKTFKKASKKVAKSARSAKRAIKRSMK